MAKSCTSRARSSACCITLWNGLAKRYHERNFCEQCGDTTRVRIVARWMYTFSLSAKNWKIIPVDRS